jgi:hypothetical protein
MHQLLVNLARRRRGVPPSESANSLSIRFSAPSHIGGPHRRVDGFAG